MNQALVTPSVSPSSEPLSVDAFVISEAGRDAVAALMRQAPQGDAATYHSGTLETFSRLSGLADLGDIVLVELGATPMADTLEILSEVTGEGTEIILLGPEIDVPTYRACLKAGAKDYMIVPHRAGDPLPDLWSASAITKDMSQTRGRTIAVCGACGGVGASLFATNLAAAFAAPAKGRGDRATAEARVGLLDADLSFGTLAVELDIEMTTGVFEALTAPERVDATFLNATMQEVQNGLSVYSAEVEDPFALTRYEAGIPSLLAAFKEAFPVSVVDLPRRFVLEDHAVLDEIDDFVLVLSTGFSAVRAAGRLLELLERRSGRQPQIWIVVSHMRRDAGLSVKEITDTLERAPSLELPLSTNDVARASLKGVPMQTLAPRRPYARRVRQFADQLRQGAAAAASHSKPRESWWKKKG